ncbi:MAG: hypothetical protein IKS32_03065 [Solobacterium sp.]|nr:hypothetical protein [Solobacterium sp.]
MSKADEADMKRLESRVNKKLAKINALQDEWHSLTDQKMSDQSGDYEAEITSIRNEIDSGFEELKTLMDQYKNKLELRRNREKTAERKARTHRLIQVGAAFEAGTGLLFETEAQRQELIEFLQKIQFGAHYRQAVQKVLHGE